MAEIQDSGERRLFDSGAVRDVQEGKGRCDLLPLDVVATFLGHDLYTDGVIEYINMYVRNGDVAHLYTAVTKFCDRIGIRDYTAVLEVAIHYEDGARKYEARNWEKGIPVHCYIDSGVRHYLKWMRGDRDEPHNRAFIWNMFGAIWTHNHKPELIDLPFKDKLKTTDTPDSDGSKYSERIAERASRCKETSFA